MEVIYSKYLLAISNPHFTSQLFSNSSAKKLSLHYLLNVKVNTAPRTVTLEFTVDCKRNPGLPKRGFARPFDQLVRRQHYFLRSSHGSTYFVHFQVYMRIRVSGFDVQLVMEFYSFNESESW